jgi:hypothetical protein
MTSSQKYLRGIITVRPEVVEKHPGVKRVFQDNKPDFWSGSQRPVAVLCFISGIYTFPSFCYFSTGLLIA